MDEILFKALVAWASTSRRSLARQGWTVLLEDPDEEGRAVMELENRFRLGRFVLQDTGRVEIGVLDKNTRTTRRGECEVYTREQLEDAADQFLEWLGQKADQVKRAEQVACPHHKIIYDNRREAMAVVKIITSRSRMPSSIGEYLCPVCHKWHIGGKRGRVSIRRRSFPS